MYAFSSLFGMSGCLAPWSRTNPLMNCVSLAVSCIMAMISIMCKSRLSLSLTLNTASVTIGVNTSVSSGLTLVANEDLATCKSSSLSISGFFTNVFRNCNVSSLAASKPSVKTRGWMPSFKNRSACLRSSPTSRTTVVVPSPVISSCAEAARAIITAVGDWICISFNRTFPSLVILILPAPSTSIFKVPFGPKLELNTSCKPWAAEMFTCSACCLRIDSALGFNS